MSDSYGEPQQQGAQGDGSRGDGYRGEGGRGGGRGGRGPGNREGGGFRIRLSENEMRSARALQEAFNLRSTVAVPVSPCEPWVRCWKTVSWMS